MDISEYFIAAKGFGKEYELLLNQVEELIKDPDTKNRNEFWKEFDRLAATAKLIFSSKVKKPINESFDEVERARKVQKQLSKLGLDIDLISASEAEQKTDANEETVKS